MCVSFIVYLGTNILLWVIRAFAFVVGGGWYALYIVQGSICLPFGGKFAT